MERKQRVEEKALELNKNYFRLQRTCLFYLGISFSGNESLLYRILSTIWLLSLIITYGIIEGVEVYINMDDTDKLANLLSYFVTDVVGLIKLGVLMHNRLKIGKILERFENGVFAPQINRGGIFEIEIIKHYVSITRSQTYLYQFAAVACVLIGSVGTLLKRIQERDDPTKWELPFVPFSLLDLTRSPTYEMIWFYQSLYRLLYCIIVVSIDTLISSTLAHISAQCRILQNGIRRIIENAYSEAVEKCKQDISNSQEVDPQMLPWKILDKHLKRMAHYHVQIIDIADQFEEMFMYLILCEFLGSLGILCFGMYQASLFDLFSMRAMQAFCYVAAISIQVFLACYWGNEVQLESQGIGDACFEVNFVGADLRFQRSLAFIIRKCRNPIVFTAAKFTDLSLDTFVWIIRASYSYYMVLRKHNG